MEKSALKERMERLLAQLNQNLFEKEKIIRLALLSAVAGESIFLLGPPGVAKSMIARRLKHAFRHARSFEYLMGKFSTPDEVFGPVSIRKLKDEDKYERLTDKYLPGANIVFLDEIWKASPPIQNSLLTVLNEKIYRNGEQEIQVDIRGLISASNELPLKGEGLEAIWDRFLVRLVVRGITEEDKFNRMLTLPRQREETLVDPADQISDEEYQAWAKAIDEVHMPTHVLGLIHHLRFTLRQRNLTVEPEAKLYVSDRRWRKIAQLLRTAAFLNERKEVMVMDCFLIADCIWDQDSQVKEAADLVLGSVASYGYRRLIDLEPIQEELESLRAEITEETQEVQEIEVPIARPYTDSKGQVYHRIPNFWGDTDAFIRAQDLEKVSQDNKAYIPMFEETGKAFRPFQTSDVTLVSEFVVENKGRELPLETLLETQAHIIPQKPSAGTVKIWHTQTQLLLDKCEENLERLESRKATDEPHLRDNLFVEASLAAHVLDSLEGTLRDLLNLKLEIQKTRHSYESMASD